MKPNFRLSTLAAVALFTGTALSQTAINFQVVGQNALFNCGMNAAATIFQNFLYVGNRTDGSSRYGFGDPRRTGPNFSGLLTSHSESSRLWYERQRVRIAASIYGSRVMRFRGTRHSARQIADRRLATVLVEMTMPQTGWHDGPVVGRAVIVCSRDAK